MPNRSKPSKFPRIYDKNILQTKITKITKIFNEKRLIESNLSLDFTFKLVTIIHDDYVNTVEIPDATN